MNSTCWRAYRSCKQTFRSCRRCWKCKETAGNSTHGSAVWVHICMLSSLTEQVTFKCRHCAEVTIRHCCRHCLGRVDATCDKFDNQLYVLKTYLPVTILTTLSWTKYCYRNDLVALQVKPCCHCMLSRVVDILMLTWARWNRWGLSLDFNNCLWSTFS